VSGRVSNLYTQIADLRTLKFNAREALETTTSNDSEDLPYAPVLNLSLKRPEHMKSADSHDELTLERLT
jgi:hypothetical protein